MVFSLNFCAIRCSLQKHLIKPHLQAAQFSPHGYRTRKNTRDAKQAEYNSIWCKKYTVKVLDTVVKVKVYESKEEELCVSFGLPFV